MLQASICCYVLGCPHQFPAAQPPQQVPGEDHVRTAPLGQPPFGEEVDVLLHGLLRLAPKAATPSKISLVRVRREPVPRRLTAFSNFLLERWQNARWDQ